MDQPVLITVRTPDGVEETSVLRMTSRIGGIEREGKLLPVLARLGLPVPRLIAGAVIDPGYPDFGMVHVTTVPVGRSLLTEAWNANPKQLQNANRLIFQGVARMNALTAQMEKEEVAKELERNSLASELQGIVAHGGAWMQETVFTDAIKRLEKIVVKMDADTSLVFSSGLYAPQSFLIDDPLPGGTDQWESNQFGADDRLKVMGFTGWTHACFEDPQIGWAKYWTYDWYPFNRAGIIERYLFENNISRAEFAPRLAIRALTTLQREVAVRDPSGTTTGNGYRDSLLFLLSESVKWLR